MLDATDKKILDLIQEEIPLVSRPFKAIGQKLGLSEEEVLKRLKGLKEEGILRHLGASIDSRRLGFVTTLCAVGVAPERAEEIAQKIALYPQVTHCYLRQHKLNIWFTLVAKDLEEVEKILKEISELAGAEAYHFPALRLFKLRATFRLSDGGNDSNSPPQAEDKK